MTASALAGDAPAGIVSGGGAGLRIPPGLRAESIGDLPEVGPTVTTTSNTPLLVIDDIGQLRAFYRADAPYPRRMPPADLGAVRWAGAAGPLVDPWFFALRRDGHLVQWSTQGAPGYQPPVSRWKTIMLGSMTAAGITESGALRVWRQGGEMTIFGIDPAGPYIGGDIARSWGIAIDAGGEARCFGIGAAIQAPAPSFQGVQSVAIPPVYGPPSPTNTALNVVWMLRTDGSVQNASGSITAPGRYTAISAAGTVGTSILALRSDGSIDALRSGSWINIAGSYSSVQTTDYGRTTYAIWSTDGNHDGIPDADQVRSGELPDLNGDLIDDRLQSGVLFEDADIDGLADIQESRALSNTYQASSTSWYWGGSYTARELWAAMLRVRPGTEFADRATLTWRVTTSSVMPSRSATFHLWRDPDNDGDPRNAVEILSVPFEAAGNRMTIPLPRTLVGQPGDVVFAGYSWDRPAGSTSYPPGMAAVNPPNPGNSDLFASSRLARRMYLFNSTVPGSTPTEMLRGTIEIDSNSYHGGAFEDLGNFGIQIPVLSLSSTKAQVADCNGNGVLDSLELASSWSAQVDADHNGRIDECESDCNGNGVPDIDEINAGGTDCNSDLVPDECNRATWGEPDCDADGTADWCQGGDCNGNRIPDDCEIAAGAPDSNRNGIIDECEVDCNRNGIPDVAEIAAGSASDCNSDGWIDLCESGDCNGDGVSDVCEILMHGDCNGNGVPDSCDLANPLLWTDANGDGIIDQCQTRTSLDCDGNGIPDDVQFPGGGFIDCDMDGVFDACVRDIYDCDEDGVFDTCEIAGGAPDCNTNGLPDKCESGLPDCDGDGIFDVCEIANGVPDCNGNGIPDDCEGPDADLDGHLDWCEARKGDLNLDGIVDAADLGMLLGSWGSGDAGIFDGDLNEDGLVNGADLGLLLIDWGPVTWP